MDILISARTTDPETSHDAHEAFGQQRAEKAMTRVVSLLREYGPMMDCEIEERFFQRWEGSRTLPGKARHWARQAGLVKDSGRTAVNPKTNHRQIVWELGEDTEFLYLLHAAKCPLCGRPYPDDLVRVEAA